MVSMAAAVPPPLGRGRGQARGSAALRRPLVLGDALVVAELVVIVVLVGRFRRLQQRSDRYRATSIAANRELRLLAGRYGAVRLVLSKFQLVTRDDLVLDDDARRSLTAELREAIGREFEAPRTLFHAPVTTLAFEDRLAAAHDGRFVPRSPHSTAAQIRETAAMIRDEVDRRRSVQLGTPVRSVAAQESQG
jgi:hypothetical protein